MSYFYSTDGICYINEHFSTVIADTSAAVDITKTCIDYTYPINSKPDSCCLNNTIYDTANSKCAYCHPGTVYDNGINRCKADTRLPQITDQGYYNALTPSQKNTCNSNSSYRLRGNNCYKSCPSGSTPYSSGSLPPQNKCYTCTDKIYNSLVLNNNGGGYCKSSTPDHNPTLLDPLPKVSKPI